MESGHPWCCRSFSWHSLGSRWFSTLHTKPRSSIATHHLFLNKCFRRRNTALGFASKRSLKSRGTCRLLVFGLHLLFLTFSTSYLKKCLMASDKRFLSSYRFISKPGIHIHLPSLSILFWGIFPQLKGQFIQVLPVLPRRPRMPSELATQLRQCLSDCSRTTAAIIPSQGSRCCAVVGDGDRGATDPEATWWGEAGSTPFLGGGASRTSRSRQVRPSAQGARPVGRRSPDHWDWVEVCSLRPQKENRLVRRRHGSGLPCFLRSTTENVGLSVAGKPPPACMSCRKQIRPAV